MKSWFVALNLKEKNTISSRFQAVSSQAKSTKFPNYSIFTYFRFPFGDKTPPTADDQPSPVIATFFAFTMFMVMLSVVATVLNLFMHHRNVVLQDVMAPRMLTVCELDA